MDRQPSVSIGALDEDRLKIVKGIVEKQQAKWGIWGRESGDGLICAFRAKEYLADQAVPRSPP